MGVVRNSELGTGLRLDWSYPPRLKLRFHGEWAIKCAYYDIIITIIIFLLLIERAIRRNWVMLYWLVDKYRMTQ